MTSHVKYFKYFMYELYKFLRRLKGVIEDYFQKSATVANDFRIEFNVIKNNTKYLNQIFT